ncbi:C-type mannose receptor 2-like [Misgurnus anguillicaudatus]|uniref:C-type mannose receptor 2-like n=1 Tax=Misgurnus anguillicaudatus TaxID=75329 RepID=UPI003CCF44C5
MEKMFYLFFFSGLVLFTQSISCQSILIQQNKTWYEAQAYCRQNHIDLFIAQSTEDWTYIEGAVQPSLTSEAWIGLYNDIYSWRWSYQNESIIFQLWADGEPNNNYGNEPCALMENDTWIDYPCTDQFPYICYNESATYKFVYISTWDTWYDAQSYCRQHYTDLASIRSQNEYDQVALLKDYDYTWIGLVRNAWTWSDGTNANDSLIPWMSGHPYISGQANQPCGAIGPDGMIVDQLCSEALPFICWSHSIKQILNIEVKSSQNPNDPAVMGMILQRINQKLKDHGINVIRLMWRVQPDGNVFSPKVSAEKPEIICSDF